MKKLLTLFVFTGLLLLSSCPEGLFGTLKELHEEVMNYGTVANPFLVNNDVEMGYVGRGSANPDGYENWTLGMHYKLMNDINLSGFPNWEPIGDSGRFTGTFDGNNKTISGLKIDRQSSGNNQGLFGRIAESSSVKNLAVTGNVKGYFVAGGVVGYNEGWVENCSFDGDVFASYTYAGGMVGRNSISSTLINCYNTGSISGASTVGGLVGQNSGIVESCYNIGSVSATGSSTGSRK